MALPTSQALGFQQITNLTTAVGLNPPSGATMALIVPEGAGVRWRDDATAPTATVGMPVAAGATFKYDGFSQASQTMYAVRFIQQSAGAILNVSYYA